MSRDSGPWHGPLAFGSAAVCPGRHDNIKQTSINVGGLTARHQSCQGKGYAGTWREEPPRLRVSKGLKVFVAYLSDPAARGFTFSFVTAHTAHSLGGHVVDIDYRSHKLADRQTRRRSASRDEQLCGSAVRGGAAKGFSGLSHPTQASFVYRSRIRSPSMFNGNQMSPLRVGSSWIYWHVAGTCLQTIIQQER